ncbi:MAG TPA: glycosyltransferase family 4 protein [Desulfuromonadaceae bacterium]
MADTGLRILMLAPTPYFADRGCHVRIYEEARALNSLGHDIRIVSYHLGRDMPGIPVLRIPNIPWYTKLTAGPSWHKLYLDALLLFRAVPLLFSFRPHVIHAHLHEGAFIGWFLKQLSGVPLLLDYQGSLTDECVAHGFFRPSSLAVRLFGRIERAIDACADRIVTSSGAGVTELVGKWGMARERVDAVIDGVDTEVFRPYPCQEGRERLAIDRDVPLVAYLGVMSRYQGTDALLDCIALLKAEGVRVHFLVMGFPSERYQQEAEARGIADMITFTGRIDYWDAPLLLSAADIAVAPKLSPTEANGKIYNYMACGLPVVAFDTPVNREALGETGIYAGYGDTRDLALKIAALLGDPEARTSYGAQVRERAVHEHAWQARARALVATYRAIMRSRPPRDARSSKKKY